MIARLYSLVLGISCLALVIAAQPSLAGGAWARGKHNGFVSLSYTIYGDLEGFAQEQLDTPFDTEQTELTKEIGLYLEYGLTEKLTFGIDRTSRREEETVNSVYFLRANYSRPNWKNSYGLEIGMGEYRDFRQIDDTQYRIGLSMGRSFSSRWVDGWVDFDGKVSAQEETGSVAWKLDSTFGIKPGERSLFYLQMQSGALDGYDTYTRAQPTYVRKLWRGLSVETAVMIGIENDDSQGGKFGLWLEF